MIGMLGRSGTFITYGSCVVIGVVGLSFGYEMFIADRLVGLVPIVSSALLVVFSAMSFFVRERSDHDRADEPAANRISVPVVMVALVIYLLLLSSVGFLLDTSGLILVMLLVAGVRRPITIGTTLVTVLVIGFLFQQVLGIDLPRGPF